MAASTDDLLPRLRAYREQITQLLIEGELSNLESAQAEILATLTNGSDSVRGRREVDDLPRRLLFQWLAATHHRGRGPVAPMSEPTLVARCQALLGDDLGWVRKFQQSKSHDRARLVVVLTWQCETRCSYCSIPKQSGREMPVETLCTAIDLLFSADKPSLELRFFGGEPLMEWERIQSGIQYASSRCEGRDIQYVITTNGYALTEARLRWLADYPVRLQIALDGLPETHNRHRRSIVPGEQSYEHSAIDKADLIHDLGLAYDVIQVVHPARIDDFVADFEHIVEHGFRRIQINWAHNQMWKRPHLESLASGLHRLGQGLRLRWETPDSPWLTNLDEVLQSVRNNREITVDWDGSIYANNAVLYRPSAADSLRLGHLEDGRNWLTYRIDGIDGTELLNRTFARPVRENNAQVGRVFGSWVRWMRDQGLPDHPERCSRS